MSIPKTKRDVLIINLFLSLRNFEGKRIKPLEETHKFTPTEHISFSFGNIQFVENYFSKLDLSPTFSKLKKKGVELAPMTEGLVAYKLHDNFSIHNAHKWLMQPEIREHYCITMFY